MSDVDGWVTIGTGLDTKQLEKDLKTAEAKLRQYEKEGKKLAQQKAKIDVDISAYEKEKQAIQEATDLTLKQAQTEEQVNVILEQENLEIEKLKEKYSEVFSKNEEIQNLIKENVNQQGLLNNSIDEMNAKLNQSKGFENIQNSIQSIKNQTSQVIKSVARWALAIFSIRSAYSLLRSSISTISQYNEQVATDIEYIRYAIANTLAPVIQKAIQLVYRLLVYVNYLSKAWFGVNLFAKSSAKNFQNAKDGVKGISKEAKKLQKQLAGFDEMNILQEDGSTSVGGGGGGTPLPSFDLAAPEDVPIPKWLQWIKDNGSLLAALIGGIAAAVVALKLGLSGLMSLGIGLIVASIIELITAIKEFINDPTWQKFGEIVGIIGQIITGLGIALATISAPIGVILIVIGQIVDVIGGLIEVISNLIDWIKNPTWDNFVKFWESCITSTGLFGDIIGWVFDLLGGFDKIVEPFHKFYDWLSKELIPGFKNGFSEAWNKIKEVFSPVVEFFKSIFTTVWSNIKIIGENIKQVFVAMVSGIKSILKSIVQVFKEPFQDAWYGIKQIFSGAKTFFKNLLSGIGDILKSWGTKIGDVVGKAFKTVINAVLKAIENILNSPIKSINALIGAVNELPGVKLKKLNTFSLPRLASGGIISQPGRGVPLAIGGEGGTTGSREGVIPLTDSRAMAQLGAEIGRNVVIELTNITKLDNRQIAREQKRINTQNDFAFNR